MKCPECGTESVPEGSRGVMATEWPCPKCGTPLRAAPAPETKTPASSGGVQGTGAPQGEHPPLEVERPGDPKGDPEDVHLLRHTMQDLDLAFPKMPAEWRMQAALNLYAYRLEMERDRLTAAARAEQTRKLQRILNAAIVAVAEAAAREGWKP